MTLRPRVDRTMSWNTLSQAVRILKKKKKSKEVRHLFLWEKIVLDIFSVVPTSVTLLLRQGDRKVGREMCTAFLRYSLMAINKKVKAEIIKLPHDKRFYTMI